jgi:superkiller protein 8
VTAKEANKAASAGFEGKVKVWSSGEDGAWKLDGEIVGGYASNIHSQSNVKKNSGKIIGANTGIR